MAELDLRPNVHVDIAIRLLECEARALDALVGYGDDAFIKVFYDRLGKAYMEEHEAGLRSLFKSVRSFLPGLLQQADNARQAFHPYVRVSIEPPDLPSVGEPLGVVDPEFAKAKFE